MRVYVLTFSRIILAAAMACYAVLAFVQLKRENPRRVSAVDAVLAALLFVVHGTGFITLFVMTGQNRYLLFYAVQLLIFILAVVLERTLYPEANHTLYQHMLLLLAVGSVIICRLSFSRAIRQTMIAGAGVLLSLALPALFTRLRYVRKATYVYAFTGLGAITAVLALGQFTQGAKLSWSIMDVSLQPSEFVKILFVLYLASAYASLDVRARNKGRYYLDLFVTGSIAALHVLVLVLSRDLGSALIFFVVYVFLTFLASRRWRYLAYGAVLGAAAAYAGYRLFTHVQVRVAAFRDPWSSIDSMGYQITQSLFAISAGGPLGLGLTRGTPGRIPFVESDFIFAAIAEEMGLIFAVGMLAVCMACFLSILWLSLSFADRFSRYTAFGFAITYAFQIFLTVGGEVRFIPLTGVTLPLVSYGGSSVLATIIMFTAVQSIAIAGSGQREEARRGTTRKLRARKQIYFVQFFFLALFASMSIYTVVYASAYEQELFENDYNGREQLLLQENIRGSILARDGQVLAETVPEENGEGERRNYPFGKLFSHIVGFSTKGRSGIESSENYALVHSDIALSTKAALDDAGEKYPGNTVVTTLDTELQKAAVEAMGIYRGAIVISDPRTGDILAMVSMPDFDPNTIDEDWENYLAEEYSVGTLLNRASQGLYPPGSTFKIMDAAEYIKEHPDSCFDYRFNCGGTFTSGGETIHCYHYEAHGSVNLTTSFARSCNSSFANIGMSLDRDLFNETLRTMMFDEKLPYDLPSSVSHAHIGDDADSAEMMQRAIGQGDTSISPLHLNLITQAIANGGILMRPRLILETRSADGSMVRTNPAVQYRRLMDAETAGALTELMTAVVTGGTATKLTGYGYTAAGKTGSAEYNDRDASQSHAWFTGFAPAEDPRVAVTVIIEGAGSGGDYAVPMARRAFDAYFAQYGLEASGQ